MKKPTFRSGPDFTRMILFLAQPVQMSFMTALVFLAVNTSSLLTLNAKLDRIEERYEQTRHATTGNKAHGEVERDFGDVRPVPFAYTPNSMLQPSPNNESYGWQSQWGMLQGISPFALRSTQKSRAVAVPFRSRTHRVASAFAAWLPHEGKNAVADNAIHALNAKGFPRSPGWCQQWVRLVLEKSYGKKFSRYMRPSAKLTAAAFIGSGYVINPSKGTRPGDIAFKIWSAGKFGHVAIRGWGNFMLENTSFQFKLNKDARTARTIKEWGKVEMWVRPR